MLPKLTPEAEDALTFTLLAGLAGFLAGAFVAWLIVTGWLLWLILVR